MDSFRDRISSITFSRNPRKLKSVLSYLSHNHNKVFQELIKKQIITPQDLKRCSLNQYSTENIREQNVEKASISDNDECLSKTEVEPSSKLIAAYQNPVFHEKIQNEVSDMLKFSNKMKAFLKGFERLIKSHHNLNYALSEIVTCGLKFKRNDVILKITAVFSLVLQKLLLCNATFVEESRNKVILPIEYHLSRDISDLSKAYQSYLKLKTSFEVAELKLMNTGFFINKQLNGITDKLKSSTPKLKFLNKKSSNDFQIDYSSEDEFVEVEKLEKRVKDLRVEFVLAAENLSLKIAKYKPNRNLIFTGVIVNFVKILRSKFSNELNLIASFEDNIKDLESLVQDLCNKLNTTKAVNLEREYQVGFHNNDIIHEGNLYVKTSASSVRRRPWVKRYFVITTSYLYFVQHWKIPKPRVICKTSLLSVKDTSTESTCTFTLFSPSLKKPLVLQTTKPLLTLWISSFQAAIEKSLESKDTLSKMNSFDIKSDEAFADLFQVHESYEPSITKIKLLNQVCSDCAASNPQWVIINLGIVVCIDCAGIHRSFGVSVSKVRSISLDSLSETKLQLILSVGNVALNEYLEASTDTKAAKLTLDRKDFLTNKYISLLYLRSDVSTQANCEESLKHSIETENFVMISILSLLYNKRKLQNTVKLNSNNLPTLLKNIIETNFIIENCE